MERFPKLFFGESKKGRDPSEYCCQDPLGRHRILARKGGWTPNTDIFETAQSVIILLDVAGVSKDDIQIVYHNNILTISGVRVRRHMAGTQRIHRIEIDYGPFEKRFRISQDLDVDKIEAEYENGMLQISIPKKNEKAREPIKIVIVHEE
jgi:HSP20 family protein